MPPLAVAAPLIPTWVVVVLVVAVVLVAAVTAALVLIVRASRRVDLSAERPEDRAE